MFGYVASVGRTRWPIRAVVSAAVGVGGPFVNEAGLRLMVGSQRKAPLGATSYRPSWLGTGAAALPTP
jgi:hypothetical protein